MTDLIIHSARLRTMTGEDTSATAVAIARGRIERLGADEEILSLASAETQVIDAAGATLTPGLIDSHSHPTWGAELTVGLDFGGMDLAQVQAAIAERAAELGPDEWIRGWNLDYKVFDGPLGGAVFDEAAGGRPIAFVLYDLHTGIGNARALDLAGIDGTETFDDASLVVVDADGRPTGELREIPAYLLLLDAVPASPQDDPAGRTLEHLARTAATGVTSTAVMDGRESTLNLLEQIESHAELPVRLHVAMWHQPGDDDARLAERNALLGRAGRRWEVRLIKLFLDGVVDTGTAWLHAPDAQGGSSHSFWASVDRYDEVVRAYHASGWQIATHSCGDAGVARAARVYFETGPAANGAPHRVEHLETLTDDDVRAVASSGLVASMQPLHMQWREGDHSDSWATRLGEERSAHAFRTRDILAAGGRIALGSDWPVAQHDARIGMAWTRLRRTPGVPDAPVFEPDQRLDGEETLLGYTRWAAEALGREDLGVIAEGSTADLALWAADPVETDPDALLGTEVLLTVVDGSIAHQHA